MNRFCKVVFKICVACFVLTGFNVFGSASGEGTLPKPTGPDDTLVIITKTGRNLVPDDRLGREAGFYEKYELLIRPSDRSVSINANEGSGFVYIHGLEPGNYTAYRLVVKSGEGEVVRQSNLNANFDAKAGSITFCPFRISITLKKPGVLWSSITQEFKMESLNKENMIDYLDNLKNKAPRDFYLWMNDY